MNASRLLWKTFGVGAVVVFIVFLASLTGAAPGQLDANFASANTVNGQIQALAVQPDGRILIDGSYSQIHGQFRTGMARLNEDGTLDPTFDVGLAPTVNQIVVQPDGRILASGAFLTYNGQQRNSMVRLLPNGKVDGTFKVPYTVPALNIREFVLRSDGKVYIQGTFSSVGGHLTTNVALLNADGSVEMGFTSSIHFGDVSALMLNADVPTPDLFVGGISFLFAPGTFAENRRFIGKLDAGSGAFLPEFNLLNAPISVGGAVSQMLLLPGGKILVAGVQGAGAVTNAYNGMIQLNPNGTVDTGFQCGPIPSQADSIFSGQPFQRFVRLADGRIVAGGGFSVVQGLVRSNLVQLLPDGKVDSSYVSDHVNGPVQQMVLQPDGKILIAGFFTSVGGVPRPYLARLHGQGSAPLVLDQPVSQTVWEGETVTLSVRVAGDPDPAITWRRGANVVGSGKTLTLPSVGLADAGDYFATLQNSQGSVNSATASITVMSGPPEITQQPEDTTVGMGATARFEVKVAGTRPIAYQWFEDGLILPKATNAVLEVRVISTNDYGRFYHVIVSTPRGALVSSDARILPTLEGQPDRGFLLLEQTILTTLWAGADFFRVDLRAAQCLALQPDGHVLIGGGTMTIPSYTEARDIFSGIGITQLSNHLFRLDAAGELAMGDLSTRYLDGPVNDLAVAADGSFYAVGAFGKLGSTARSRVIKFHPDATLDANFSVTVLPTNAEVTCVALQSDGRVVIGGTFTNVGGLARTGVAQLLSSGAVDTSFVTELTEVHYGKVLDVATQADGKVLASGSGSFWPAGSFFYGERPQLIRFHADGSWDEDFDTYGGARGAPELYAVRRVRVLPDQRILIGGSFNRFGGESNTNLARLLSDGSSDPEFNPRRECCESTGDGVNDITVGPDGAIYVAGQFRTPQTNVTEVVRLFADGSYDPSWFPAWMDAQPLIYQQEQVRAVIVQPDQRPILAGNFVVPANYVPANASKFYWEFVRNDSVASGGAGSGGTTITVLDNSPQFTIRPQSEIRFHLGGLVRLLDESAQPGNLTIYVQPQGAILSVSTNYGYVLAVAADIPNATARMSYQWMKNGLVLPDGTNSYYPLYPITLETAGAYSVLVSGQPTTGPGQNVLSQTAKIKVMPAGGLVGNPGLQSAGFSWPIALSDGQTFTAADLPNLSLQKSSNLVDWVTIPNAIALQNGTVIASDPAAQTAPIGFYRLHLDPQ